MRLSFIIVTWNTSDITKKCIDTINQFVPNQEIIAVDNGSTDDTVKNIQHIKNVKIIENGSNFGFSKANNIGFKISTSEYVVFLNSDIELIDNSILKMLDYIKKNENIGIIGPKFLNQDLTPQASIFPKQTAKNAFIEFWLKKPNTYSKYLIDTNSPTKVWAISGGCLIVKKTFFKEIGMWNEKYFFYFEDMDLSRKVNQIGKEVFYFPECKVIHQHGASGRTIANNEKQWKRLIPGSIKYHGFIMHYLINTIIWSSQKFDRLKTIFRH